MGCIWLLVIVPHSCTESLLMLWSWTPLTNIHLLFHWALPGVGCQPWEVKHEDVCKTWSKHVAASKSSYVRLASPYPLAPSCLNPLPESFVPLEYTLCYTVLCWSDFPGLETDLLLLGPKAVPVDTQPCPSAQRHPVMWVPAALTTVCFSGGILRTAMAPSVLKEKERTTHKAGAWSFASENTKLRKRLSSFSVPVNSYNRWPFYSSCPFVKTRKSWNKMLIFFIAQYIVIEAN